MIVEVWTLAFWGVLGGFAYAGPRLLVAVTWERLAKPLGEFTLSLIIAPIGAAGFTIPIAHVVHQSSVDDLRAIAVILGMISNPIAPSLVYLFGTAIVRRLGGDNMKEGPTR
jgi:hypothetical protein